MAQFSLDLTGGQRLCEAMTMAQSHTDSTELMLDDTCTVDIIERTATQALAAFRHLGIGQEALTNLLGGNLVACLVAHDRPWTQHVVIGDIGQQHGTLHL